MSLVESNYERSEAEFTGHAHGAGISISGGFLFQGIPLFLGV